jgi:hypothetical protein
VNVRDSIFRLFGPNPAVELDTDSERGRGRSVQYFDGNLTFTSRERVLDAHILPAVLIELLDPNTRGLRQRVQGPPTFVPLGR